MTVSQSDLQAKGKEYMRIVTWNCNMALHSKLPLLLALKPDIAIVPESADTETLSAKAPLYAPPKAIWSGDNRNKGISVFAFGDYDIERDSPVADADDADKWFLPIRVTGPVSFHLLAAWVFHKKKDMNKANPGPILRMLDRCREFLAGPKTVIAGDFNHNVSMDKPGRLNNFSNVVQSMSDQGFSSAYHAHHGEDHGSESQPTIYWQERTRDGRTYHLDYCFVSEAWQNCVAGVEVGGFDDWVGNKASDHTPVIVDIDERRPTGDVE